VERGILRFEVLHDRGAHDESVQDRLNLWIDLTIVGLRILLCFPQTDCRYFLLSGVNDGTSSAEVRHELPGNTELVRV
jgi:hypothetical protein